MEINQANGDLLIWHHDGNSLYDIARDAHYEITMGINVARDIHCDVTMSNDVTMCTYGITMNTDIAMNFFYYFYYLLCA